jgi:hypothetical protein
MATINLGAIKFNWKGAFNNGTTYAVDDVVSSGGNSYVCIQASQGNAVGNATAYWNIMSSAGTNGTNGTNGTDVGTVITTQGDMLYRDGSGLQRLAKGTAGQDLRMNSGANAPEWYTPVPGGNAPSFLAYMTTNQTGYNPNTWYDMPTNAEKWDTDNANSTSPGDNYQFVIPSGKAGKYVFDGYIRFYGGNSSHSTSNSWLVRMRKKPSGGSYATYAEVRNDQEPDINQQGMTFNFGADLAVGDAVNVQFYSNVSAGTYSIAGDGSTIVTYWKGFKIG